MKIAQICFSGTGGHSSVVFSLVSADHKKNHEWFVGFIGNEDLSEVNECQAKKFKLHYKSFIFVRVSEHHIPNGPIFFNILPIMAGQKTGISFFQHQ